MRIALALSALASLPVSLQAHRQWMLPSSTVLSGTDGWVTIDAAVSNELFYFDHVPLRMTNLVITGPDGGAVKAENTATGKYRTTFDVHLTQAGTYKIASVSNTVFATWKEKGETKTWRGTPEALQTDLPPNAEGLQTSRMSSRVEVFVTAGKPSTKALEPTGIGLEMVAITHPNDLVAGEAAKFQFLQDGKPAANLEVTLIAGGIRYRNQLGELKVKTDSEGKFSVTFKDPGMYWLNATTGGGPRPGGGGPGAGPLRFPTGNRANYVATVEVLPQ
jgi:uncharacterized GH25 family protein